MKKLRWIHWLLFPLALLVGLVLMCLLIGAMLPKNHTATRSAHYRQPPDSIWQTITDYQRFPDWRKNLKSVTALPAHNGKPSWRETDSHGQMIPYVVDEWTPPRRLVTRIADPNLPFGGTWTMEIEPADGGGSTLHITENGEVSNLLFRFMSHYVFGETATMEEYLKFLGAKFGENTQAEP